MNDTYVVFGIILSVVILGMVIAIVVLSLMISKLRKKNKAIIAKAQDDVSKARASAHATVKNTRVEFENKVSALNAEHAVAIKNIEHDCEMKIQHCKEDIEDRKDVLSKMDERALLTNVMFALDGYAGRLDRIEKVLYDSELADKIERLFMGIDDELDNVKDVVSEKIDEVNNTVDNILSDTDIITKLDDVISGIDEIKSHLCDDWNSDSVISKVDDIKSEMSNVKYAAEAAKYAAERALEEVESHY